MESKGQVGRRIAKKESKSSKGRCSISKIHTVLLCFARFSPEEILPWR